jgi:hypothetical protein
VLLITAVLLHPLLDVIEESANPHESFAMRVSLASEPLQDVIGEQPVPAAPLLVLDGDLVGLRREQHATPGLEFPISSMYRFMTAASLAVARRPV